MTSLLIRADANTAIGAGHLMRCLALAEFWRETGDEAHFLSREGAPLLLAQIESRGFGLTRLNHDTSKPEELASLLSIARKHERGWIVLDGYDFDSAYQQSIRAAGHKLLVIDDMAHLSHYHADLLLNQNVNADQLVYHCDQDTMRLLGLDYVLLRPEFLGWRDQRPRAATKPSKVLVTLGGADVDNVTLKVIEGLQQVDQHGLEVKIIVGPANPHLEVLSREINRCPGQLELLSAVNNMPELMVWADLAVSAAGSTCWELAYLGVPTLMLIVAENQRPIAERLDEMGMGENLGHHEKVSAEAISEALERWLASPDELSRMSQRAQTLVDGRGAGRVIKCMKRSAIKLRPVGEDDCRLLWEWANEPSVRAVSFSSQPISWEEHASWFSSKLDDPQCSFRIAMDEDGSPVGQVRCDINEREAVISISIDRMFRGRSYGNLMIALATQEVFDGSDVEVVHAYIKQGNIASTSAFAKAGYQDCGTAVIREQEAIHLVRRRESR